MFFLLAAILFFDAILKDFYSASLSKFLSVVLHIESYKKRQ